MRGIEPSLYARFAPHQWRILTNHRSDAKGVYRKLGQDTFTTPIPLAQHHRTIEKDFVLIEVLEYGGALGAPWAAEIEGRQ